MGVGQVKIYPYEKGGGIPGGGGGGGVTSFEVVLT